MQIREANAILVRTPGDDLGRTRRLGITMTYLARAAAHDPQFVWWARAAVRDVPSKAHRMVVRRLLEWVRQVCRYRYDPLGLEWQQDPRHTLLVAGDGDCNNQTALVAALALALGYPAIIRFVKADKRRPNEFSHVYVGVAVPDGAGGDDVIALDTTQAQSEPGWQPPYWESMDFDVASWTPANDDEAAFWSSLVRRYGAAA